MPGSSPSASRSGAGRASGGGAGSASAAGGGADEPARGQHVERAGALADEVRRRLEARLPAHAAAGQQRDALLAEEPAGRLGGVARVGVVGQEADERPAELLPERGEHERQRRLGDARAGRERLRERLQPLVRGELADEGVKDRTVHDDGTRHASRPGSSLVERP